MVCADSTIISVAERNMQGVVPLYYQMAVAKSVILSRKAMYDGMIAAYTGGNIGAISNDITKIWNSKDINVDVIKLLCMEGNFSIDFAKTLYKPQKIDEAENLIKSYTNRKLPHFFIYAKDKAEEQTESELFGCVDKIRECINPKRLRLYGDNIGKFDYTMLMRFPKPKSNELSESIISKFIELSSNVNAYMFEQDSKLTNYNYIYRKIKYEMLSITDNLYFIVDTLVKYLFATKKSKRKIVFWECFGDVVVRNLQRNLRGTIACEKCGKRFVKNSNRHKLCAECAKPVYMLQSAIKTLVCPECGKNFRTPKNSNTLKLCDDCASARKRFINRQQYKRRKERTSEKDK